MQSQSNTQSSPNNKSFLSLRERCGINFHLTFTPPTCFKSTQPSYNNIPRRQKRTCAPPVISTQLVPSSPLSSSSSSSSSPPGPAPAVKPGNLGSQLRQFLRLRREENYANVARCDEGGPHYSQQPYQYPLLGLDDGLDDLLATPVTPQFAMCDESRCLQQLIPGCYVAFEDDNVAWFGSSSKDALATPYGRRWTHVVSISQPPAGISPSESDLSSSSSSSGDSSSEGSDSSNTSSGSDSSDTYDEATQTLRLFLPPAPNVEAEDEDLMQSVLTDDQLLSARDFLSFHGHALNWDPQSTTAAQAYYNSSSPSLCSTSSSSTMTVDETSVRLLVKAPRNRRADALSVALCYLAFAFNSPVETFLRELHAQRRSLPVWKYALDREAVERIERVAEVSKI